MQTRGTVASRVCSCQLDALDAFSARGAAEQTPSDARWENRPAIHQSAWSSILSQQASGKSSASAACEVGNTTWWVPFYTLRRNQCPARRRRNSGCGAEATAAVYGHVIGSQQRDAVENRSARIEQYAVN